MNQSVLSAVAALPPVRSSRTVFPARAVSLPVVDPIAATALPGPVAVTGSLRVVVCHPEPLSGHVMARAVGLRDTAGEVATVRTVSELLHRLAGNWDVAFVAETAGTDLPELLQALEYRRSALPVVTLTGSLDPARAAWLIERGASGTVDTRRPLELLHRAVGVAATGGLFVDDHARPRVAASLRHLAQEREQARRVLASLSERERSVITALSEGVGVTEIARNLLLSPHTIRSCIRVLGAKLEAAGQLQIAAVARSLTLAAAPPSMRYLQRLRTQTGGSATAVSPIRLSG